jgi:transcriptional regulator
MYNPVPFKMEEPTRLFDFIENNSFGILVSINGGELQASHLPVLLDRSWGTRGALLSHMAQANTQWETLAGREVMMVFNGPHAYVSPTWYGTPESVPTWNYVSVHVYGRFIHVTDGGGITQILGKMTSFYERALPEPWDLDRMPADYFRNLLGKIVGFRVEISRMEGKWKLSQNHPAEKRERVIQALEQGGHDSRQVAQWMREVIP